MPIRQQGSGTSGHVVQPRQTRQRQIEVKILARRPPVAKPDPSPKRTPLQLQRMPQRGSAVLANARRVISNGMVVDKTPPTTSTPSAAEGDEESVMAIQKFLDSTNAEEKASDVKVPSGVK